jgi:hypothetical protein
MVAEGVGTAFLLAAVVGSGIMGERPAGGNVAIALLANTIATGAALVALILAFGPISGAHLNPAVTLADASQAGMPWRHVPGYLLAIALQRGRLRGRRVHHRRIMVHRQHLLREPRRDAGARRAFCCPTTTAPPGGAR